MQNSKQKINKPNTQKFKGKNNQKKMDYLEHRNIHATKSKVLKSPVRLLICFN